MNRFIVLLRGINVGTARRIAMAELRELTQTAGFSNVRTMLNSGNMVVDAPDDLSEADVAASITSAIAAQLQLDVPVAIRTVAELEAVLKYNPFAKVATNPRRYSVTFLTAAADGAALSEIKHKPYFPDRFELHRRELYMWLEHGYSSSALAKAIADAPVGDAATNRNWNTLTKLHALASS